MLFIILVVSYKSFPVFYFVNDVINIIVCLEAQAMVHWGVPPGTHCASKGNASNHMQE